MEEPEHPSPPANSSGGGAAGYNSNGPARYNQNEGRDSSGNEADNRGERYACPHRDGRYGGEFCIHESWTVRELKDECWGRGLRSFAHLNKAGLLARLHQGRSVHSRTRPKV